jgi:myosin-crossreactive antigen
MDLKLTIDGAFAVDNTQAKGVCVLYFTFKENLQSLHLTQWNARRFFKTNGFQTCRLKFTGITSLGTKHYDVIALV